MGLFTSAKWAVISTCLAFPIALDGLADNTEIILSFLLSSIFIITIIAPSERDSLSFSLLVGYGVIVSIGCSLKLHILLSVIIHLFIFFGSSWICVIVVIHNVFLRQENFITPEIQKY